MARRPTSETPNFISILDQNHDDIKPAGLVPPGPWHLRGLSVTVRKKTDETTEQSYETATLMHEPVEPTSSVDPDEVAAVDEHGASLYDGKRIYTTFFLRSGDDKFKLLRVMEQHGIETAGRANKDIFADFKGSRVVGVVYVKPAKGEYAADNAIRGWCSEEDYEDQD